MVKLAWRNIWRNKRRSLITIASVFFAFFFCVLLISMQSGAWGRMIENILRTQVGHIQVHQKGYFDDQVIDNLMTMDESKISEIEQLKNVAYISPRLETFAMASYGNSNKAVALVGIDPARENRMSHLSDRVVSGNYLTPEDSNGILVGKKLSEYLQIQSGDTVALISQGYHGASANGLFIVRGIVSLVTPEMDQNFIYTTIPAAQEFVGLENGFSALLITLDNENRLSQSLKEISDHLDTDTYEVLSWKTSMKKLLDQAASDEIFTQIMMFILYMIVGFGILSTVIMMTNERRHEFGVVIALGMQHRKLATTMVLEMLIMIFIGIVASLLVTIPIIQYFHLNPIPMSGELKDAMAGYGMEAVFPFNNSPLLFIKQMLVVMIITIVVTIYPVRYIFKLNVINALKN